ncbi:MAG TPA: hypothetical protein VGJ45_26375 [Pseudonocardiaceae bacterium]|jgi:hypothetical protein
MFAARDYSGDPHRMGPAIPVGETARGYVLDSGSDIDEDDSLEGTEEPLEADDADVAEQWRVVPIPADEL